MTEEAKIERLVDAEQLKLDTSFGEHNFDDAVQEQAGLVAHYGVLQARAERQAGIKKLALEALEARLYHEIREDLTAEGAKITEVQIEKAIKRDSRYLKAAMALNEAKSIETLAKIAMRALSDKRDMLIQTGSDRRKEMSGTLRIMEQEAKEQRVMALRDKALEVAARGSEH